MPTGHWREIVQIAFRGERFHDHALDITALSELANFQEMIAETARAMWRAAHPDRERLPAHFEERTRLCLRTIQEGSVRVPLEVYLEAPPQPPLIQLEPTEASQTAALDGEVYCPEPVEALQAVNLVGEVYRALGQGAPLPAGFPRSLIPTYQRWGQGLAEDEEMTLLQHERPVASVTSATRARLATYAEAPHQDLVDLVGEVLEADLRLQRFQLWLNDRTCVPVSFSSDQEEQVTNALREHHTLRLHVKGRGEFSAQGTPLRVSEVSELRVRAIGWEFDPTARPIEDVLEELASEVPDEEWARLPQDLSSNLDYYLYGEGK